MMAIVLWWFEKAISAARSSSEINNELCLRGQAVSCGWEEGKAREGRGASYIKQSKAASFTDRTENNTR